MTAPDPETQPQDDTIEVPDNVLVHCPIHKYKLIKIRVCIGCMSFAGFEDRFPGSETHPFAARYRLKCSFEPVRRDLQEFAA